MFGFLTFGTLLAFLDLAVKNQIEGEDDGKFPREIPESKGMIWLYKNHNPGFSFGVLKERPKFVERIPLCLVSGLAGAWFYLMGTKGRFLKKTALTLALAGGVSNLCDRLLRGYVVDYFSIRYKALKKVVFNLGDFFIGAGVLLYLAAELFEALRDAGMKAKKK